jgi:signal transduction histidine kinase
LEDNPLDAELTLGELNKAGFDVDARQVETKEAYIAHLEPSLDVILADYHLPQFDAPSALRLLHKSGFDIPFIIVSGTVGEEAAVAAIKEGADDYLLKDRLKRLESAITQAMEKQRLRQESRAEEEQLRQAQKMETVGQLASGVAHDFNNFLTVIQGFAELLQIEDQPSHARREQLQEIILAAERAGALTRRLLMFSRKQPVQRRALDLTEVVSGMTRLLQRALGESIPLALDSPPKLPPVHGDAGMMEQILLNLAVNARDAMPSGGRFAIRLTVETIDAASVRASPQARPGEFVRLEVRDTGCGMPPEVKNRIFEPFFTTKAIGKGTGLGLATVFGIVQQHDGWIEVDSEVNRGTTFRIYFPVSEPASEEPPKQAPTTTQRGGSETILLVEDDSAIRQMAAIVLGRQGYRVVEAGSGVAALEVWRQHAGAIDLVITDMVMPGGLTGAEMAEKLCAEKPSLKVVFSSGYTADMDTNDLRLEEGVNFLQKPYLPEQLVRIARNRLDD